MAELLSTAILKFRIQSHIPPFGSNIAVTFQQFYPLIRHRIFIGCRFYAYYGFI
jgi:hypothetical protein